MLCNPFNMGSVWYWSAGAISLHLIVYNYFFCVTSQFISQCLAKIYACNMPMSSQLSQVADDSYRKIATLKQARCVKGKEKQGNKGRSGNYLLSVFYKHMTITKQVYFLNSYHHTSCVSQCHFQFRSLHSSYAAIFDNREIRYKGTGFSRHPQHISRKPIKLLKKFQRETGMHTDLVIL